MNEATTEQQEDMAPPMPGDGESPPQPSDETPQPPPVPDERAVPLEEGLGDQNLGGDEEDEVDEKAVHEDVMDVLQPKVEPREWTLGKDEDEMKFVQNRLSFIGKMEWFSLVGDVIDNAMAGENPLTINNFLSGPLNRTGGALTMDDLRDADMFVHAVGKLLKYSPEFLLDSYCIWLGVDRHMRPLVKMVMQKTPDEGGLTDDQGFDIIETFIDQNYEDIDRFFRERLAQLQKRVQIRAQERGASRQSKR